MKDASRMPQPMDEAKALLKAGKYCEAAAALEALLASDPGNADAWAALGEARGRLYESAGALAAYRKSLELAPGDLSRLASLAWGLWHHASPEEALEAFRRLAISPGVGRLRPDWQIARPCAQGLVERRVYGGGTYLGC